ncbi:MAG: response regulator [Myxococcales bacterium]|nr:response regulator [Myxococcales bacterium]
MDRLDDQLEESSGAHAPIRALLADDDAVARRYLGIVMRNAGFDVVTAEDGPAVLARLEADPTLRLLILDWVMPPPDGVALCEIIRTEYRERRPYVIAVTGREPEHLHRILEAGADDILTKPVDARELRTRLVRARHVLETGAQRSLRNALEEALAAPGGEIVVRGDGRVARIHVSQGHIVWVNAEPSPVRVTDVLARAGVDREGLEAVLEECRRHGRRFDEVIVEWGLVSQARLREELRVHFESELRRLDELGTPSIAFVPRKPREGEGIGFTLQELAPWLVESPPLVPSERPRSLDDLRLVEAAVAKLKELRSRLPQAEAIFLLAADDGRVLMRSGEVGMLELAWSTSRLLSRATTDADESEELVLTTHRVHCLGRWVPGTRCVACVVVRREQSLLGFAMHALSQAVQRPTGEET